jgi:CBS domain-containing protein
MDETLELRRLLRAIASAADNAALRRAAEAARVLEHGAVTPAPAETATRLISAVSDALTRRAITLAQARSPQAAQLRWCWIALGSEGRREQTFVSDQDNGIIFDDQEDPDALRSLLLPLALRINDTLADCGFPLCEGGIMASRPDCCLSLHEWRERFLDWITEGDPQALLNASIFFDLRPLHGDRTLAHTLSGWLAGHAADNRRFLFQMADNALRRTPPLRLLGGFALEKHGPHAGAIDLKHNAATLYVDAARVFGLACGSGASNTARRLRLAARAHLLDADEAEDWIASFHFIGMLRLRMQQDSYLRGVPMHNHVRPEQLDAGQRRLLLRSLRRAGTLQQQLSLAFLRGQRL